MINVVDTAPLVIGGKGRVLAGTGGSGTGLFRERPRRRSVGSEVDGAVGFMSSTLLTENTAAFSASLEPGEEPALLLSSTAASAGRDLERRPRFRFRLVSVHIVE